MPSSMHQKCKCTEYMHGEWSNVCTLDLEGQQRSFTFLLEDLVVLVDDGHSQQDTSARADGTQEVGEHGQCTDAHTAKSGRGGDVAVEFLLERLAVGTVALDHQSLLGQ